MRTSYINTTHSTHPELTRYEEKAKSQEERILRWFKTHKFQASPNQVLRYIPVEQRPPITSIRRALTNLTNAEELVKTDKQVKGPYGRPEHLWKLAPKYDQREMF